MELRVTGPLAFLMAKIDALRGRDKPKDAYDIVWLIECWPGGPAAAAASFAQRPTYPRPEVTAGLNSIRDAFAATDRDRCPQLRPLRGNRHSRRAATRAPSRRRNCRIHRRTPRLQLIRSDPLDGSRPTVDDSLQDGHHGAGVAGAITATALPGLSWESILELGAQGTDVSPASIHQAAVNAAGGAHSGFGPTNTRPGRYRRSRRLRRWRPYRFRSR
jgi:hypothetical protein